MQQVRAKINHLTHPSPSPSSIELDRHSGGRPLGAISPASAFLLYQPPPPMTSTSHHRLRRLRFRLDYGSTGRGKLAYRDMCVLSRNSSFLMCFSPWLSALEISCCARKERRSGPAGGLGAHELCSVHCLLLLLLLLLPLLPRMRFFTTTYSTIRWGGRESEIRWSPSGLFFSRSEVSCEMVARPL